MDKIFDLAIIGGGINGAGIAADAALRGLEVALFEQDDLASYTSSMSSKLIHGGLRYLETYDFRLVREALIERDVLLQLAPHLIHPLRIIMPHNAYVRPSWMIRLGLWLYDHLYLRESLPKSRFVRFTNDDNNPLQPSYRKGYEYSDCTADDARLVVANALQAKQHGASIYTHHEVLGAVREKGRWRIKVQDHQQNVQREFFAKALINVAGPWVENVSRQYLAMRSAHAIRLVKGSHIVLPKLYDHDKAYILQNPDKRIVFVIPYRNDFTLVGTTDVDYQGDPKKAVISDEEKYYLCESINRYFKKPASPHDVLWSYSGVRPLQDDDHANPSKVTRDYTFDVNAENGAPPLITVFGGKLTTYRKLAEKAVDLLLPYFPSIGKSKTHRCTLPGGDLRNWRQFTDALQKRYAFLDEAYLERLARAYGTRIHDLLVNVERIQDLGQCFGANLYEREVQFLINTEWAVSSDDILWRRSKMGLWLKPYEIKALEAWLQTHLRHPSNA